MKFKSMIVLAAIAAAGCSDPNQAPVVFGQSHVVGVSVGASATGAAPDFTVGYKDANIAILPTNATTNGENYQKRGASSSGGGQGFEDTYSTLGQFQGTAEGRNAGLNKFFATGLAAQKLSAGFACAVSEGRDKEHCHNATDHKTFNTGTPAKANQE